jgi:hypothetical protein
MSKPVTPQDMFELWQRMVNPGAYPLQSLMFPVLDPKELEKKIAELQVVEHWLKANVNMVQMTMKSLQFQLAMLKGGEKGLQAYAQGAKAASTGGEAPAQGAAKNEASPPPHPAMWMWDLMTQAAQQPAAEAPMPKPKSKRPTRRKPA